MRKVTNRNGTAQGRTPFRPPPGPSVGVGTNPLSNDKTAFTRVELLVVIAVVFFLGLLLTPGFARTRVNDHTFQCLNNLRTLQDAWQMYAEDNAGRVIMNTGAYEVQNEVSTKMYRNWVNNIVDWTSNQMNTNVNLLLEGPMTAYLGGEVTVFKCPADNFVAPVQLAQGWTARTRSYSMNAFWGPYNSDSNDLNWPRGRNFFLPQYRQWIKLAQPSNPASSWVLIEEHPDSINEGYFLNTLTQNNWGDTPASQHDGAVNISFADGHIETHLWRGASTRVPVRYNYLVSVFDTLSRADYQWLMQRTTVPFP